MLGCVCDCVCMRQREERERERTCGGFIIAQNLSTGYIPKFEILQGIVQSLVLLVLAKKIMINREFPSLHDNICIL
jgi:hypothetical protein